MDKVVTADKDDLDDLSERSISMEKIKQITPKSASQSRQVLPIKPRDPARSLAVKSGNPAKGKSIDKMKRGATPKRPKRDLEP